MKEEPHPKERVLAMKKVYPDAVKEEPPGAPQPLGEPVSLTVFTDADHAGDKLTRRSHTGIILMVNSAIITSTFGAELIALRTALEMTEAFVHKMTMFGVKVDDTPVVLCDNSSVVINTRYPESLLKKKHLSIAYHWVCEAVEMESILIYFEKGISNLADLFTKVLPANKRKDILDVILA